YLINKLRDPDTGLFYSSQDADEEYYMLGIDERKKRPQPYIDKNIYSCKNAQCAIAFLKAGIYMENEQYVNISKEVFDKLVSDYLREDVKHSKHVVYSYLDDNVYLLDLSLQLYSYSLEQRYLEVAKKLGEVIIRDFIDVNGLLKDNKPSEDNFGLLKDPYHPISENSLAMKDLYILSLLTGNNEYDKVAKDIASILAANYMNYTIFASSFANNLLMLLNPIEIRLVYRDIESARIVIQTKKLTRHPLFLVEFLDYNLDEIKKQYPKEAIYVCKGQMCYPPVSSDDELDKLLEKLVREALKF
ncbi:MAG TPA: hypothetical protein VKU94_03405, partial [Geobacterales bacterium]|nr:hypothetical protein [Geobacterales bacterium]